MNGEGMEAIHEGGTVTVVRLYRLVDAFPPRFPAYPACWPSRVRYAAIAPLTSAYRADGGEGREAERVR